MGLANPEAPVLVQTAQSVALVASADVAFLADASASAMFVVSIGGLRRVSLSDGAPMDVVATDGRLAAVTRKPLSPSNGTLTIWIVTSSDVLATTSVGVGARCVRWWGEWLLVACESVIPLCQIG